MRQSFSFFLVIGLALLGFQSIAAEKKPTQPGTQADNDVNRPMGAIVLPKADALKIELPVEKFQLANGLTVLLLEDHTIPLIAYHTWYKVGSRDESPGVTGAAHMLEHMMFKGAEKYSGKQFDQLFHANGIVNNAFTSYDYTGFHQTLPSSKLEMVMDMEVDRMKSLKIDPKDLLSEKEVVASERRWRIDDNPSGQVREALMTTFFKLSNYRWPVIGFMEDINAYTSDKLRYFYHSFYGPNNAVLVLVGDFDSKKVRPMVEKYYGSLQRREVPQVNIAKEAIRTKVESATIKGPVKTPTFVIGMPSVPVNHEDMHAMDLLGGILGQGSSSRLYREIVYKQQLGTSAYSYNWTLKDEGILVVGVSMKKEKDIPKVSKTIFSIFDKIKKEGVKAEELQRIKTSTMKGYVDGLTTIDGKAQSLAVNEIVSGSYKFMLEDLEKYEKVTLEDIQRVAKKYLNQNIRVEITQLPK